MAFKFKIDKVHKHFGAGVGILDGTIVDGRFLSTDDVNLIHDGAKVKVRLTGTVLDTQGLHKGQSNRVSISVSLREPAMRLAASGDLLVSA